MKRNNCVARSFLFVMEGVCETSTDAYSGVYKLLRKSGSCEISSSMGVQMHETYSTPNYFVQTFDQLIKGFRLKPA